MCNFEIGVIVGTTLGVFLGILLLLIIITVVYRKRAKEPKKEFVVELMSSTGSKL
jgi:putative exporter of polyketide antibiotics